MRIFAQTLAGEVRTWFISLPPQRIDSLEVLYQQFLNRWAKKNNPLQILLNMKTLKGDQTKLFKTIAPGLIMCIMQSHLTLCLHLD